MKQAFDLRARDYDKSIWQWRVAERLVLGLPISQYGTALDVCAGTGHVLSALNARGILPQRTVAVDRSMAMIRHARSEAAKWHESVSWLCSDATRPGIDGHYDLVTCSLGLQYVPIAPFASSLRGVLDSHGIFALSVPLYGEPRAARVFADVVRSRFPNLHLSQPGMRRSQVFQFLEMAGLEAMTATVETFTVGVGGPLESFDINMRTHEDSFASVLERRPRYPVN